jgi:hypothetical protein
MSSLKELRRGKEPAPLGEAGRRLAAALLQRASRLLARLASGLASAPAEHHPEPRFEYHAEAGAPEGALYVDGRLVGWLSGVRRL